MGGISEIEPVGVQALAHELHGIMRDAAAGGHLRAPAFPGSDGGLSAALAQLARADVLATTVYARGIGRLTARLQDVAVAAVDADLLPLVVG